MINNFWTALSSVSNYAFNLFISVLPTANTDTLAFISNASNSFRSMYAYINWIFPVDHAFIIIGFVILIESSWLSYFLAQKVVRILSLGRLQL